MKVKKVEEISPIKKKIFVEISEGKYLQALDGAYQKLNKKVAMKGFRKGKTPRSVLERYYKDETESKVLSSLIEDSYLFALKDQNFEPVAPPQISDLKKEAGEGIHYVAEVEIRPTVELKDYKGIALKKPSVEPTEEEILKELEVLRERQAQIVPFEGDGPIASGQIAIIDFSGTLNGEAFEGGSGQAVSVELGQKRFLPDFEQGIVGMKKGETKNIKVEFPKDYGHATLAGQKADFQITLNDIKEKKLPELNDDFAKELGSFTSLQEIKSKIKEHAKNHKEQQAKVSLLNQIVDSLIAKHSFEIPEALVEQELNIMLENFKGQLAQQKLTLEQVNVKPENFRTENREAAIRRVRAFFLFEAVAKLENISITHEEIHDHLRKIAQSVGQPEQVVERYYHENKMIPMLQSQILEEKIYDFLLSVSNVKDE